MLGLIAGQAPRDDGDVILAGEHLANFDPRRVIQAGVAFVPAERGLRGTMTGMNVRENLSISDLKMHVRGGRLRRKLETQETHDWIKRLSIKTSSTESPIASLSGGNQQKVMFGKALRLKPKLLLLDEPAQGIDIGAKDQIHTLVEEASRKGVPTIVGSTDTD